MTMEKIEIIGMVAAVLTTGSFVPQVYKTVREKSTKDISLTMYTAMFIGVTLWFVFGVLIHSISMMLANGITALLLLIMIGLKLKYK
jgi:MtN3 and saliva related transmembrane protein